MTANNYSGILPGSDVSDALEREFVAGTRMRPYLPPPHVQAAPVPDLGALSPQEEGTHE